VTDHTRLDDQPTPAAGTIDRRHFFAGAAALAVVGRPRPRQRQPPNILQIVLDDTNDWLPWFGPENLELGRRVAYAPNLEALATRSRRYLHAYVAVPKCLGSRLAALTGQDPGRTGIDNDDMLAQDGRPTRDAPRPWFRSAAGSVFTDLHAAGYRQYVAGKVDHCYTRQSTYLPHVTDITRSRNLRGWHRVRSVMYRRIRTQGGRSGRHPLAWYRGGPDVDRAIVESALRMPQGSQPWHLAVGLVGQHHPVVGRPSWTDRYPTLPVVDEAWDLDDLPASARPLPGSWGTDERSRSEFVRAYLASVSSSDHQIGRLLNGLDLTNTVVIVWSDHGYSMGHKRHFGKARLDAAVLRVPLLVSGPGVVPADVERPVSLLGLRATVAELVELPPPTPDSVPFDAQTGDVVSRWRGSVSTISPDLVQRIDHAGGGTEVYDLRADPGARTNLATNVEPAQIAGRDDAPTS
jgi:arylsulfatase A-like enzyme